jgi:prevent-host-death family protein
MCTPNLPFTIYGLPFIIVVCPRQVRSIVLEINIKELRHKLAQIITQVEAGEEIAITRRGKVVARLIPPSPPRPQQLPDLTEFRASIKLRGEGVSETLIKERRQARY